MKLLIVPDVHGRDFWIKPCKDIEKYDKIIFLGDYHDPYPFQVSEHTSRKRLREELVPFVEDNKDKIICLKGNHDCNYTIGVMADRHDHFNHDQVKALLERMNLQLAHQEGNFLFTHSGVLPAWLEVNNLTLEDVLKGNVSGQALSQVSPRRGGWDHCGSCVWGDVFEYHNETKIPGIYQIFGHTMLYPNFEPIITSEFACLDTMKCYSLDTEEGYESLTEMN